MAFMNGAHVDRAMEFGIIEEIAGVIPERVKPAPGLIYNPSDLTGQWAANLTSGKAHGFQRKEV
jgi:hypothetical protein